MPSNPPAALRRFGSNVRKEREAAGLSQEALAHAAGLNMTSVARIERAEREPGALTLAKIASALGVDPGVFFRGI